MTRGTTVIAPMRSGGMTANRAVTATRMKRCVPREIVRQPYNLPTPHREKSLCSLVASAPCIVIRSLMISNATSSKEPAGREPSGGTLANAEGRSDQSDRTGSLRAEKKKGKKKGKKGNGKNRPPVVPPPPPPPPPLATPAPTPTPPPPVTPTRYGFVDTDFLYYSYFPSILGGGEVTCANGVAGWEPEPYWKTDPVYSSISNSAERLHHMLTAYRGKNPEATFVLVGHSLGGLVAFTEILNADQSELIDTVITIDSPLHGAVAFSSDLRNWADTYGMDECFAQGQAIATLEEMEQNRDATRAQARAIAQAAANKGITLVTMGNDVDCVYDYGYCLPGWGLPITGYADTQWVEEPGANAVKVHLPLNEACRIELGCITPECISRRLMECTLARHSALLTQNDGIKAIAGRIGKQIAGGSRGACGCPSSQMECANGCTNTTSDRNNCGFCGNACPSGQSCQSGLCESTCTAAQRACDFDDDCCGTLICDPDPCSASGENSPSGKTCCAPTGQECSEHCDCCDDDECFDGLCVDPGPTCGDRQDACESSDECCGGISCADNGCRRGRNTCCLTTGQSCATDCDCCGTNTCVNGICGSRANTGICDFDPVRPIPCPDRFCCRAEFPNCCLERRTCCGKGYPTCCPPVPAVPEHPTGYCCLTGFGCCSAGCCASDITASRSAISGQRAQEISAVDPGCVEGECEEMPRAAVNESTGNERETGSKKPRKADRNRRSTREARRQEAR